VLRVPSDRYPTIQSAVEAAKEGDKIVLDPSVAKDDVPKQNMRDVQAEEIKELRTILLPDVDSKGLILDLASGELVEVPKADTLEDISLAIDKLNKGDLVFDNSSLILVRGTTTKTLPETTEPFNTYKIGQRLPEVFNLKTREGVEWTIEIHSVDNNGCQLQYYPVHPNKYISAIPLTTLERKFVEQMLEQVKQVADSAADEVGWGSSQLVDAMGMYYLPDGTPLQSRWRWRERVGGMTDIRVKVGGDVTKDKRIGLIHRHELPSHSDLYSRDGRERNITLQSWKSLPLAIFVRVDRPMRLSGWWVGNIETDVKHFDEYDQLLVTNPPGDNNKPILVTVELPKETATGQIIRTQVESKEGWGEAVDGLRVGMSIKKTSFAMEEPIQIQWRIKNVSQEDKTIIWHKFHYSPVVFEIGKSGEKKYIREDERRLFNDARPGPPEKLILKPGETKEAIFDLRRFGLNNYSERGTYEVTGLYSPKNSRMLTDVFLQNPEFKGVIDARIDSATIEITLTEDLAWLRNELSTGTFQRRLSASRSLVPIIGNKDVLAELEKMYPSKNTREMVWLVDHMAQFGDLSHVGDVLDMYEAGGYAPHWKDYGDDMLVFLLKWGRDRGIAHLIQYLAKNKDTSESSFENRNKRNFLKALVKGSYWSFNFEISDNSLPLLILVLDEKTVQGGMTLESGKKVELRWCDSAALAIQKMLKRDWGFQLELPEQTRDGIINQMRNELSNRNSDVQVEGKKPKVVSVRPASGSEIALVSELIVTFNQPIDPDQFQIVDASLEDRYKHLSEVAALNTQVIYDPNKYQFTIPLILPCNWNGSVKLSGFKSSKGVEAEPLMLNYSTLRKKFSRDLLERFEKARESRELKALVEKIKEMRSNLKSLSETVNVVWDYGELREKRNQQMIFKVQGNKQFYVDMSEAFDKPWHIGSDGNKCWFYNEFKDDKKLVMTDFAQIDEKNIGICEPFGISKYDVDEAIKQNNLEYIGTEILDERRCHLVRGWSAYVHIDRATCKVNMWWVDAETYMPAQLVTYLSRVKRSQRFIYEKINQPIDDSEFRPDFITDIEPEEPEPLGDGYETRFINAIDGSSTGRMSVRWGKRGPAGTSSSGLN